MPTPSIPLRVLVVDDEKVCTDIMTEILTCWGCTVRGVYQGEDGLMAAAEFQPDVILLDLAMPRMDGYACIRELYAKACLSETAVFAVTGFGDEEHRKQAMQAGFDEFLAKPVDLKQLEKLLRREVGMKTDQKPRVE
jgi:CheY-like chemotaxis protein